MRNKIFVISAKQQLCFLLYLMVFFSSLVVFQFNGRTFFLYLQIIFCIVFIFVYKKVVILPSLLVNMIFLQFILTVISGITGNMTESYKKASLVLALYMIPMYFSVSSCFSLIKNDNSILILIKKAFKAMCFFQLLWIPLQYFMYHIGGIDINQVIFVDTFKLLDNASFIRSWVYYPSGFTWHSAVLAPMFVIAFFLFKSLPFRTLIFIDAIICGNSTALIGVLVCACLYFVYILIDKYKKKKYTLKAKSIIIGMLFVGIMLIILFRFSLIQVISDRIIYLWTRLFGNEIDASTEAHLQYFADYVTIFQNSSLFQILFGYGEGCSGYTISQMYNRYTSLGNWAIECDIINILVNRGIVGFVLYYVFLMYIAIKGRKKDIRYFIVMISILIQGFGYNVQWDYVFFIELIMFFSLKLNLNFFEIQKGKTKNPII